MYVRKEHNKRGLFPSGDLQRLTPPYSWIRWSMVVREHDVAAALASAGMTRNYKSWIIISLIMVVAIVPLVSVSFSVVECVCSGSKYLS